jgi:hypothetical protein
MFNKKAAASVRWHEPDDPNGRASVLMLHPKNTQTHTPIWGVDFPQRSSLTLPYCFHEIERAWLGASLEKRPKLQRARLSGAAVSRPIIYPTYPDTVLVLES